MVDVVRAGWLMKESSFLKRWKKHWFALSADGYLRYFDSPDDLIAKKTIFTPKDLVAINIGWDAKAKPPDGMSSEFLLKLVAREENWVLCAESVDEMLAWQFALEQARVINQQQMRTPNNRDMPPHLVEIIQNNPNNGYPMYYRGTYNGHYPSRIVHTPQGPITVVYIDNGYYHDRYYRNNASLGLLTGAAVASTLMWPFWFPFFWF